MSVESSENGDSGVSDRQDAAATRAYETAVPDSNPFTDVIENLREQGLSWDEVHSTMAEAYNGVESAWGEEMSFLVKRFEVTVKAPASDTPSGYRYKTMERYAPSQEEAEAEVRDATGYEVVSEKTEFIEYAKVS